MIIYLDKEFKCRTEENADTILVVETDVFDGKCAAFIEGYRFVPTGQNWTRPDGVVFQGEMVAPFVDYIKLDNAQREYERELLADMESALKILLEGEI